MIVISSVSTFTTSITNTNTNQSHSTNKSTLPQTIITMRFTLLATAFLLAPHISSILAAPTLSPTTAVPVFKRSSIVDDSPGDLTGNDLKAWNACVAVTVNEQGRSCGSLTPGTGAQDGCYAAEITIQKPCENAGVQKRLTQIYCSTQPPGTKFC